MSDSWWPRLHFQAMAVGWGQAMGPSWTCVCRALWWGPVYLLKTLSPTRQGGLSDIGPGIQQDPAGSWGVASRLQGVQRSVYKAGSYSFLQTLAGRSPRAPGPTLTQAWVGPVIGMEISEENKEKVAGSGWGESGDVPRGHGPENFLPTVRAQGTPCRDHGPDQPAGLPAPLGWF